MSKPSDPTQAHLQAAAQKGSASTFDAAAFEQNNVHDVYEAIASHFSDTRYKPWPLTPAFLHSIPQGCLGADLGCGNGKYLAVESILAASTPSAKKGRLIMLGMDRSSNLIDVALTNFAGGGDDRGTNHTSSDPESMKHRRHEVAVGDAIHSSYRTASFDFAISIATIHHFATLERRAQAIAEMIRIVRPIAKETTQTEDQHIAAYPGLRSGSGRFLIVVWALEQRGESRRRFEEVPASNAESEADRDPQDLLVPWILRKGGNNKNSKNSTQIDQDAPNVYQRFYHVFKQGELEELVDKAAQAFPHIEVRQEIGGWEKGNWYGIWQCVRR